GTQEPRKNLVRLIKAYQSLGLKKITLVIVGKFGWGDQVKPIPGIKILGFVPDEDLRALYSAAKVFAYPSLYEGFGLPILEAFSCGCPVITSNIASLPELGGSAAIYINPLSIKDLSQAIKQLLQFDDSNYRTLREKAIKQAKKFSWEKTAKETLKVYQEVYENRD
ncbi:glycosyltransferase family 4 protein, partial [Microgenomates group bacterium]|nr:glycosyltransferase family 4 protein [Microgenomates group bacterium]